MTSTEDGVLANKHVAIIGGGPGGTLCAAHLARLGAQVTVFERQDREKAGKRPGWNIALGRVAENSIEAAGLSSDFGPQCKAAGIARHTSGTPAKFFGAWVGQDLQFVCLATRDAILSHIKAEAERVYGGKVLYRYGMRLVGGDVCVGEAVLEVADGSQERCTADLIVGADGVHSTTRQLISEQDASFTADLHSSPIVALPLRLTPQGHPSTYAGLVTLSGQAFQGMPSSPSGTFEGATTAFVAPVPGQDPGMVAISVSCRQVGEDVGAVVTASAEWWARERSEAKVRDVLLRCFPHLPLVWHEDCVAAIVQATPHELRRPTFVMCNSLGSGHAVLIGDAAHAMAANIGMGCNTALLDCEALAAAAAATGGDMAAVAQQFTRTHLREVIAVTRISRRVQDSDYVRFHGNRLRALLGLPFKLATVASRFGSKLPKFLRPRTTVMSLSAGEYKFSEIERDMLLLFAKATGALVAMLLVICAVMWKVLA